MPLDPPSLPGRARIFVLAGVVIVAMALIATGITLILSGELLSSASRSLSELASDERPANLPRPLPQAPETEPNSGFNHFEPPPVSPATSTQRDEGLLPVDPSIVIALLAVADVKRGEQQFKKCAVCHSYEKGAAAKVGPNLWGIAGNAKAAQPGFRGYSSALSQMGGEWTVEDLAAFLNNPRLYAPGTSMAFRGIRNPVDLANLVAYLRTLSDSPASLPN